MSSSGYVGDVRLFETPYKHAVRYARDKTILRIRTSEMCGL